MDTSTVSSTQMVSALFDNMNSFITVSAPIFRFLLVIGFFIFALKAFKYLIDGIRKVT